MSIVITFQAYGNVTMDCTIVSFYSQAKVQLRMLRYNMEHLVEFGDTGKINAPLNERFYKFTYKDDEKEKVELQERLKKCVIHYHQITR